VVAAVAVVVVLLARSCAPTAAPGPAGGAQASEPGNLALLPETAKPLGATSDYGIELGQDGVPGGAPADSAIRVDVISDYICPFCQRFAQEVGPGLEEALAAGQIRLVVHPLGYLDQMSTTGYSSRAAKAAVTVAALDPTHFSAFDQALWDSQPPEGGPGLSDEELADLALKAGVKPDVADRLAGEDYAAWVEQGTKLIVGSEGFQGTPWVLIGNGETAYQWNWSEGDLQAAIAKVAAGQAP
jgi:protein-disulfide isomerase